MKFCIWSYLLPFWSFMSNMPTMPLTAPVRFPRGTVWRIQEHTVHFTVEENCPVGTKLGKITPAQSPLTNGFEADSQLHSGVKYQFGAPSSLFTVDEQTGMVSTVGKIDAEQLCAKARDEERSGIVVDGWVAEEQPTILDRVSCPQNGSLTVHVDINMVRADASLVSIFRTIIHVKDLNDNAPYFDQPRWHRRLKEALYRKGRRLDLPKAQDNDVTLPNRQIRYRLEPSVKEVSNSFGPFRLEISPTGQPGLVLMEDLDAELYSAYHLILVAYGPLELDRDRTVNTGWSDSSQSEARLEIYIEVIDMNDNEPRFARTNYNISVSEDTPVGSIIYQLTAHDPDKSANLTYSIKPLEKGVLASSTFHVTPDGRVQLSGPLDYEGQRNYELPVQVKDGEFNAYTTLFVSVLDTNDEPPRFEINPKQIVASEHAVPGKLIGQVRIYDPDGEEINGHVRCFEPPGLERNQPLAFLPDPRQNPFALVYDLTTRVFLDRESEDQANGGQMRVYLVCTDGSDSRQHGVQYNEKHTSTMTIVLTVKDENDHPPVFDQPIYHVAVYENNAIGEKLIQVHATDSDEGPNAQILYSLLDFANFKVDPNTGWITANRVFDRETRDSYQVTVIASDQGVPQLSSSVLLNLTILDRNDHAPRLVTNRDQSRGSPGRRTSGNQFVVDENAPANTFIGTLEAVDEDSAENAQLHYQLMAENEPLLKTRFSLLANGSLFTAVTLDREEQEEYRLTFMVTDKSLTNPLSTTATVTIIVRDLNDNPPEFIRPKELIHTNQMESIRKVHSENAHWLYDQPLADSKELRTNQERGASATMESGQDWVREANGAVQRTQSPIHMSLHEKPGYLITTLQATDPDKDENAQIVYRVEELRRALGNITKPSGARTANLIRIDPSLGHIVLTRELDESDLGVHLIRVSASDRGLPNPRNVSKILILLIEDVPKSSVGSIYLNDPPQSNSTTSKGLTFGPLLLIIPLTVLFLLIVATILIFFWLYKRNAIRCDHCMRQKRPVVVVHDRNRKQIVKSSTSSVIQSPYFLNNAPYDDQKQTTVMTDEERRKLTAASEESERSCIHTFPDKPDESSGSNMHSPDALEASFLQLTEYGPGQDEKQTIRSAPDLIDPKDSCAIPLTFISKRDQYECYKHPFDDPACTNACSSINSPPNTFLSAVSCTHDLEKPISSNSAFEGSYVLTSQPLYDHIKRFTSSELHPVKVSIQQSESAPVSEVQAVVPADHLVAFPAVNYSGVGQHLLLAATPAHGSPFSTMNQLRLVNIVVDPEQMFPQEVIGLLSGEENYPDSGAM